MKSKRRNKAATSKRKNAEKNGTFRLEVVFSGSRKNCKEIESFLISSYGSITEGGKLLNFTKGGDGGDTFSYQTPERKKEIIEKIRESSDPNVRRECGLKGGPISAEINKERGNGPWDPEWRAKGRIAYQSWAKENRDQLSKFGKDGAKVSWEGERGGAHRETNSRACRETGKKNKGRFWVNNGELEKTIEKSGQVPEGFVKGKLKRKWINNGEIEIQILATDTIEEGFSWGRVYRPRKSYNNNSSPLNS